jgi:hypothetical protein
MPPIFTQLRGYSLLNFVHIGEEKWHVWVEFYLCPEGEYARHQDKRHKIVLAQQFLYKTYLLSCMKSQLVSSLMLGHE